MCADLQADKDGNNALDWDEFLEMQPTRIRETHSEAEIREWFEMADVDGNGSVSINEFFIWTLQKESLNGMEGLRAVFQAYDTDNTGCIDMAEFQQITDDLGFGAAAHEVRTRSRDVPRIQAKFDLDGCAQPAHTRSNHLFRRLPQIFLDLDDDNSGVVQYSEILERLMPSTATNDEGGESSLKRDATPTTKKFLMAIA